MVEKVFEQLGPAVESTRLAAYLAPNLDEIVRGEVRQPAVLQIRPELFHWIQFRRVRWQPHDGPPADGVHRAPHEARPMGKTAIPEEDRWAAEMPMEMADEPPDVRGPDVLTSIEGQVECDTTTAGRDDQGPDAREFLMPPRSQREERREALWRPGPADERGHEKARFVDTNQARAEVRQFFLLRIHSPWIHARTRSSTRSFAVRCGRCGVNPQVRRSRPT